MEKAQEGSMRFCLVDKGLEMARQVCWAHRGGGRAGRDHRLYTFHDILLLLAQCPCLWQTPA